MKQSDRRWLAYEKNQLLKAGFKLDNLDRFKDMPVEYITGEAEFYKRSFKVDEGVLIPRAESEGLVDIGLNFLLKQRKSGVSKFRVIEVGTGSGNIGISLMLEAAAAGLDIELEMTDVSEDCLEVARLNADRLLSASLLEVVQISQSDLLENAVGSFDLIVANLPYIPHDLLKNVSASVKYYEPDLALDGGSDGLNLIKKFINQAETFLKPSGLLLLEIDARSQINRLSLGIDNKNQENLNYITAKDIYKRQRYILIGQQSTGELTELGNLHSQNSAEQTEDK